MDFHFVRAIEGQDINGQPYWVEEYLECWLLEPAVRCYIYNKKSPGPRPKFSDMVLPRWQAPNPHNLRLKCITRRTGHKCTFHDKPWGDKPYKVHHNIHTPDGLMYWAVETVDTIYLHPYASRYIIVKEGKLSSWRELVGRMHINKPLQADPKCARCVPVLLPPEEYKQPSQVVDAPIVTAPKSAPAPVGVVEDVEWVILPPGCDPTRSLIWQRNGRHSTSVPRQHIHLQDRLSFLRSLPGIKGWMIGRALGVSKRRYLVAIFEHYVVAECDIYGNAIYLLPADQKEEWKQTVQLTKTEVTKRGAIRIIHDQEAKWKVLLASYLMGHIPTQ